MKVKFFPIDCWGNNESDYESRIEEQEERLNDFLESVYVKKVIPCPAATPASTNSVMLIILYQEKDDNDRLKVGYG